MAEDGTQAGYSDHDLQRWLPETHLSPRSDFARDRARLLHSSALRRLAAATDRRRTTWDIRRSGTTVSAR